MKKNYFKRALLLLGAAAMVTGAYAKTEYVDVTRQYITDPSFVPGWQGVIGDISGASDEDPDMVGEVWNGAFNLYQNLGEQPAGKYVLTANAFYRCGNNDYAKANQGGNADLNTAYIYINDAKATVKALWEGRETAPNNMWEAKDAFKAGEYLNTVEYDHQGGVLVIGIKNTGCYNDEWCCFDNFALTCDGNAVAIQNGDFSEGFDAKRAWDNKPKDKTPDHQKDGSGGGDYRKCGGTEYNHGQQVDLPAGTYRFSMPCFHRYGSTVDEAGVYYNHKWPLGPAAAYGVAGRTPQDWFKANDYDTFNADQEKNYNPDDDPEGNGPVVYAHAYIYAVVADAKPTKLEKLDAANKVRVKDCWEICNGDFATMPDNNPRIGHPDADGNWPNVTIPYDQKNKCTTFNDSGIEREAAAAFTNDPEKWRQGIEFTLTEPAKVWVGLGKDSNTGDGYWHAYADIRLDKVVEVEDDPTESIMNAANDAVNAPVEYFNIMGQRVANPSNGMYIVKQGKKVSKQYIR